MENCRYPFVNLPLPYEYDALEPFIDEKTMHLHHDRHLQTYIDNLNSVLKKEPSLQQMSLEQLIRNAGKFPKRIQTAVSHNAGGVYNHRFFFSGMSDTSDLSCAPKLVNELCARFESVENFFTLFKSAALSVFGSGYAWLVYGRCGLRIMTSPNQNSPVEQGFRPIIALDVWEHAYYLKHYNLRGDYIDDWFKVIDWKEAEKNYVLCTQRDGENQRRRRN